MCCLCLCLQRYSVLVDLDGEWPTGELIDRELVTREKVRINDHFDVVSLEQDRDRLRILIGSDLGRTPLVDADGPTNKVILCMPPSKPFPVDEGSLRAAARHGD